MEVYFRTEYITVGVNSPLNFNYTDLHHRAYFNRIFKLRETLLRRNELFRPSCIREKDVLTGEHG